MKLSEIKDESLVSLNLLLLTKEVIPSRNGKDRLELTLSDGVDRVRMLAWNAVPVINAKLEVNTTYFIQGK